MPHAEAAVADGRIVTVDFDVLHGRLAVVRVVGPFADTAQAGLTQTLSSCPADLEATALAARIRAAIPFGVDVSAVLPRSLADAIRRAIGGGTSPRVGNFTPGEVDALTAGWKAYRWRILPERPFSAAMNVAVDEVLSDRGQPCLRFWKWTESAVILGRCQSVQSEVNRDAMRDGGVSLVRRLTGGGAMFVQSHGTITYSLVLPEEAVAGLTIRQSYEACDAWVVRGLRDLGVDAHYVPVNDIACAEGKIGGAAQARRRGGVLHHTTIAYDLKADEMTQFLRIGHEKPNASGVASAAKVVSPLTAQIGHPRETIVGHVLRLFQGFYGGTISALSPAEVSEAEELVHTKYGQPGWTNEFA
ncbi:lipoate--protein ligase family protein [Limnoglobus roseus]|uniref:Lipoate--protein ligase family protein n=1 Tax=Limnoglobus roseus TaxID=2598579 RepID=A0A5C1AE93_9BACT|nr:lipoate--protein ligase family protein [Limnoglobus roseus]QEL16032.1 lipoate--protein ligase family protein [Limnoglobus roseus]